MTMNSMIVGRLARDVKTFTGPNGDFLSGTIVFDSYDKETKTKAPVFTKFTVNQFGPKLVPYLVKGAQVALAGMKGKDDEYEGKVQPTMLVNKLTFGKPLMVTMDPAADGKVMALITGRLGKDAHEAEHEGKKFLSFSVATDVYNKETKSEEVRWVDVTMNRYGDGLVAKLTKGTQVALQGLYVVGEKDGKPVHKLYVNELEFFGNKKSGDVADAANAASDEASFGLPSEDDI